MEEKITKRCQYAATQNGISEVNVTPEGYHLMKTENSGRVTCYRQKRRRYAIYEQPREQVDCELFENVVLHSTDILVRGGSVVLTGFGLAFCGAFLVLFILVYTVNKHNNNRASEQDEERWVVSESGQRIGDDAHFFHTRKTKFQGVL